MAGSESTSEGVRHARARAGKGILSNNGAGELSTAGVDPSKAQSRARARSTSCLEIRPKTVAVVVDYIVGMAFANQPVDFTLRAYHLAHGRNMVGIDAGELFSILIEHYLLKRAVSTAELMQAQHSG